MRTWSRLLTLACLVWLLASPGAFAQELRDRERPQALVPLYISFAALQALDVHSTTAAIEAGGRETNPVVRSAMTMPAGAVVLKAGTAAGVVYLTEKLWKRNRAAAIVTMVALNSAYVAIAAHNYGVGRRR